MESDITLHWTRTPTDEQSIITRFTHDCIVKHVTHTTNISNIPTAEIAAEETHITEHVAHMNNILRIPTADISVKSNRAPKKTGHIRNIPNIPTAEIPVKGFRVPEHATHTGYLAKIRCIRCTIFQICAVIKCLLHTRPFNIPPLLNCDYLVTVWIVEAKLDPRQPPGDLDGVSSGEEISVTGLPCYIYCSRTTIPPIHRVMEVCIAGTISRDCYPIPGCNLPSGDKGSFYPTVGGGGGSHRRRGRRGRFCGGCRGCRSRNHGGCRGRRGQLESGGRFRRGGVNILDCYDEFAYLSRQIISIYSTLGEGYLRCFARPDNFPNDGFVALRQVVGEQGDARFKHRPFHYVNIAVRRGRAHRPIKFVVRRGGLPGKATDNPGVNHLKPDPGVPIQSAPIKNKGAMTLKSQCFVCLYQCLSACKEHFGAVSMGVLF